MALCASTPSAAQYDLGQTSPRAAPVITTTTTTVIRAHRRFHLTPRSFDSFTRRPRPTILTASLARPLPSHDSSTSHLLAHHSHQPAHHNRPLYRRFSNMARRGAVQRSTETVQDDEAATPALISPPESKTPPTASHKRNKSVSRNSEPVDASALSKALKDFEQAGKARERTPIASPSRKRPRIQGDR